jgi:hypothetical protein
MARYLPLRPRNTGCPLRRSGSTPQSLQTVYAPPRARHQPATANTSPHGERQPEHGGAVQPCLTPDPTVEITKNALLLLASCVVMDYE